MTTDAYITLGSSYAAGSTLVSPYSDGGFEELLATYTNDGGLARWTAIFTNSSGSNRTVREVYANVSGTWVDHRTVLLETDMANNCVVPNGGTVAFTFKLASVTPRYLEIIAITLTMPSTPEVTDPIVFNSTKLPNGSPPTITAGYGGLSFSITCATDVWSEFTALQALCAPAQTGVSITGKQFVISALVGGSLYIKNMSTGLYDTYENCYIQSVGPAEPHGSWWWFPVTIIQSAYEAA